jgi:hypothetical protein
MKKPRKPSASPLAILGEKALRKAVADALAEHKRSGRAIVVWRNNQVVRIPAEQIAVREVEGSYIAPPREYDK